MKKIYYIAYLLLCLTIQSCDDFLTVYPEDKITTGTFFKSDSDFESAANGMYATMTGYPSVSRTTPVTTRDKEFVLESTVTCANAEMLMKASSTQTESLKRLCFIFSILGVLVFHSKDIKIFLMHYHLT